MENSISDLTTVAQFTRKDGMPAVGLSLNDISLTLIEIDRVTGKHKVIWNGTQHPVEEISDVGCYVRTYKADIATNKYSFTAIYCGFCQLKKSELTGDFD